MPIIEKPEKLPCVMPRRLLWLWLWLWPPASVSGACPRGSGRSTDAYMVVFKSKAQEKSILYQNLSRDVSLFCHKKFE